MPLFKSKSRSKSTGRSPSRGELEELEELVIGRTEIETNEPIEQITESTEQKEWETLKCLADLTTQLDEKKIDGQKLNKTVENLFKIYGTEHREKLEALDRRFNITPVRLGNSISPPVNLKGVLRKTVDLDRLSKLQRLFQPIPIFTNSAEFSIRELLSSINNIVESLGFELSEQEFKLLLSQKLSPRIKTIIKDHQSDSIESIYNTLLNLYDLSESKREAFSCLVNNKTKPLNLRSFIEETLRLLALSLKSPDQQAQLFIHSLESVLPPRIYEKITDFCDHNEAITGQLPSLPSIVDLLYKYRLEIDSYITKSNKKPFISYNRIEYGEDIEQSIPVRQNGGCSTCNKTNHTSENCYQNRTCDNCGRSGHVERFCKQEKVCKICRKTGHVANSCFTRCRLCNDGHRTVVCPAYPGIEPAQVPCSLCLRKTFMKLFHPASKCINFSKN